MVLPWAEPVSVTDEPAEFSEVTFVATALVAPISAANVVVRRPAVSMSTLKVRVLVVSAGMIQSISEKVKLPAAVVVMISDADPTSVLPS